MGYNDVINLENLEKIVHPGPFECDWTLSFDGKLHDLTEHSEDIWFGKKKDIK